MDQNWLGKPNPTANVYLMMSNLSSKLQELATSWDFSTLLTTLLIHILLNRLLVTLNTCYVGLSSGQSLLSLVFLSIILPCKPHTLPSSLSNDQAKKIEFPGSTWAVGFFTYLLEDRMCNWSYQHLTSRTSKKQCCLSRNARFYFKLMSNLRL